MRRGSQASQKIKFNKTDFVDKELIDKVSLWMLRIILECGGHKEFIDKSNYIREEEVAYFLGSEKFLLKDDDEFTRDEFLTPLYKKLEKLENKKIITGSKVLSKNIKQLSKLMDLNIYEENILEFFIILDQFDILSDVVDMLGNELNTNQFKTKLSNILNINKKDINKVFTSSSKFSKSMIITIDKGNTSSLTGKIDFLSDEFIDNMMNLDEDISVMIQDSVRECNKGTLKLKDFQHISTDIDILTPYMKNAILEKQIGVNILLYGLPGTGKTELVKSISNELKIQLYEISYASNDDDPIDGNKRLRAYKTAQYLFNNDNIILMYDEAEDIFESNEGGFFSPPQRQRDKAWINRVLETNVVPTIWITNNISAIDNAIVRRFDMAIEMPIPSQVKREEILRKYSSTCINEQTIKILSNNENIAPALVSRASKVIERIPQKDKNGAFKQIINNTLKAQGYDEIKDKNISSTLPNNYNPQFINCSTDLKKLTSGIKQSQNARLCLYGVAGTGKSAFGQYIAKSLGKKVMLKKASDLQSKWVGECEQNIARAFKEATEKKAVLIFDEVDSFLQDRTNANASWEVSQVNEMLVQMENFDGIFIATTNLIDNIDRASLRRFDLKLEFNYLLKDHAWKMFLSYAKELNLLNPSQSQKKVIQNLAYLTPGDFAAVVRQNRFRPVQNIKDFIDRLQDEVKVKNVQVGNKMGFMS